MDISEVARRANVSTATVSRVLNGGARVRPATQAHVRQVIAELQYVPNNSARNLRVGSSKLFGLIVSDITNPFFPELIDSFEALAAAQGIDVIFTHTNYDSARLAVCIRRLIERNVDGIAVMTSEVEEQALESAARRKVPLVLLNQAGFASRYPNVWVDYSRGFREAVEHLQQLGHRDIAFLSDPKDFSSTRRRGGAFRAAMRRFGMTIHKEWLVNAELRVEGGHAAMTQILAARVRPTALVTTNDLMAVGALQAAYAAGVRVPEDISIVGFDDLPVAGMTYPPLTTIRLSRSEIAAHAFSLLLEASRGAEAASRKYSVTPRLVVRGSTAQATAAVAKRKASPRMERAALL